LMRIPLRRPSSPFPENRRAAREGESMETKLLILLRHGKAEERGPGGRDFDRPLAPKGEADALSSARKLLEAKFVPDLILTSGAERALATARIAAETLGRSESLVIDPRLYEAGPSEISEVVAGIGKGHQTVMLVGHNPGMEDFASFVTGRPQSLGKAEAMAFAFSIALWGEFGGACGRLVGYHIKP
jgi:phosphohistidine phosphatase